MFENLLNQALTIIPKQKFTFCKYKSNTINDIGIKVDVYETGIDFEGSVQAIDSKMYQELGLDFSKKYIQIYSSLNIQNVTQNQETPDRIVWNNKNYLVTNCSDWYVQDGWTNIIAVEEIEEKETTEEEDNNVNSQSSL